MTHNIFEQRRTYTQGIVSGLQNHLKQSLDDQYDAVIGDHTCVYATGSCGRGEMSETSDLDAYSIRVYGAPPPESEAIVKALKAANSALNLPPLDGDGKYVRVVDGEPILGRLGAPNDDDEGEKGVFTKRILLMLESRVLLGENAYRRLLDDVLGAYWQNENLHPNDYLPLVLVNDIVRYWRIVLLNHESRLRDTNTKLQARSGATEDLVQRQLLAERRYSSYKLRLPRCLSCFSALTYLLALTQTDPAHVSKDQIMTMVALTPTERMCRLPELAGAKLDIVDQMLDLYAAYLQRINMGKPKLLSLLESDTKLQVDVSRDGSRFTKLMFELIQTLGGGRPLHRHMVV
jgi:hypothetical protein